MNRLYNRVLKVAGRMKYRKSLCLLAVAMITVAVAADNHFHISGSFFDPTGQVRTFSKGGEARANNAFFQSLGTNGRSCVTCHQASDAWSVTPEHIRARFDASEGLDPIFRTVDGANCPSADVHTLSARRKSYSMLLTKGLIRVSIGVPAGADFAVTGIDDPNNCAETTPAGLALFRRPLPATNLPFLTTVMWDGRESFAGQTLNFDLSDQAVGATLGHAQGAQKPTDQQVAEIVNFEMSNFTAQSVDDAAGELNAHGATGGPDALASQAFFVGINDPLGGTPPGVNFNPVAMTMFSKWASLSGQKSDGDRGKESDEGRNAARAAVARGEALFNSFPIPISGVSGLNDLPGVPDSFVGSCTTCHNTPNVANHSVALPINIGIADYPPLPALDISGLPVYTIQCATGARTPINHDSTVQTTDPARALISGKCADIGKTKGPILRGLAARAPYFHNGSAATLRDVVNFYDQRFNLNFTEQQKSDLVAFLRSL